MVRKMLLCRTSDHGSGGRNGLGALEEQKGGQGCLKASEAETAET